MQLDNLQTSSDVRLNQIIHTLTHVYGMEFNIDPENSDRLLEYQAHYQEKQNNLIKESNFNTYLSNPEYTKSILILEAIKIMLTEIAPKRRKKTKQVDEAATIKYRPKIPAPNSFAQQLMDIASKIQSNDDNASAFSNALSSIGEKLQARSEGEKNVNLTQVEKDILDWIRQLPRPVNVTDLIAQGIEKFGEELKQIRTRRIDKYKNLKVEETKKKKNDGDVKVDDVMIVKHKEKVDEADDLIPLDIDDTAPDTTAYMPQTDQDKAAMGQAHHYEYQASMARGELYRNAKYAMSMMKQVDAEQEIQPWIAASLTKAASQLDKIFHYLDYYKKFEPEQLPENMDEDMELGETSGSIARQNLMMIIEYSTKLFDLIKPGDKLEGWVAMKLTTASESISSCKHYLDYVQFEHNGLDDHFSETLKSKKKIKENTMLAEQEDLAKASTILAAKEMCGKIQSIAEDVAKMSVEDLMPLVDVMRQQFGPEATNAFNELVKNQLDQILEIATETKEKMDAAVDTLNKGGVPSGSSDIESAGEEPDTSMTGDEAPDLSDEGDEETGEEDLDLGAEEPETTSAEPLGRRKKEELAEKWDAKMHTAKKDVGKWDGYSVAELKAKKEKLMKKDERSAAEQKTVKQLNFAIRAKQKNKWGKVNEEDAMEGNEFSGALADAKKKGKDSFKVGGKTYQVKEGKSKHGVCKECGTKFESAKQYSHCKDHKGARALVEKAPPGKKAEDFITQNKAEFKKRHGQKKGMSALYATAWKKFAPKNESYFNALAKIENKKEEINLLSDQFALHQRQFKSHITEGKVTDPLKVGYGLAGQEILNKLEECQNDYANLKASINKMIAEGIIGMIQSIKALNRADSLEKIMAKTPYGVIYTTANGEKSKKLFESESQRNYWLSFKSDSINKVKLINPEDFKNAIHRAKKV